MKWIKDYWLQLILALGASIFSIVLFFSIWKVNQRVTFSPIHDVYLYYETLLYQHQAKVEQDALFLKEGGQTQVLAYGPYTTLRPGQYTATFEFVIKGELSPIHQVLVEVVSEEQLLISKDTFRLPLKQLDHPRYSVSFPVEEKLKRFETRVLTNSDAIGLRQIQLEKSHSGLPNLKEFVYVRLLVLAMVVTIILIYGSWYFAKVSDRRILLGILFILPLFLALILPKHQLTGDEPIYLINMKNLLQNQTLQTDKGFTDENIREFIAPQYVSHWLATPGNWQMHKSVKTQEYYSNHGFIMSLLLIPGYIVGGLTGVYFQMGLFVSGIACLLYFIMRQLSQPREMAFSTSLLLVLTTPLIYYTYAIYPEVLAALALLVSVSAILNKSYLLKLLSIVTLGLLLFLKTKYIFPVLLSVGFILFSYLQARPLRLYLKDWKFWALLLTAIISVGAYFVESYLLFGSLSLFSHYTGGAALSSHLDIYSYIRTFLLTFLANFFHSRAGLFVWAPIAIFAPIGIYHLFTSKLREHRVMAVYTFLCLSSYLAFYSLSGSIGGDCPPLRPWITVLPLIAILVSVAFHHLRYWNLLLLFFVPSVYQIIGSYIFQTTVVNIYNYRFNPFFLESGTLFSHFGLFIPQMTAQRGLITADVVLVLYYLMIITLLYALLYKGRLQPD